MTIAPTVDVRLQEPLQTADGAIESVTVRMPLPGALEGRPAHIAEEVWNAAKIVEIAPDIVATLCASDIYAISYAWAGLSAGFLAGLETAKDSIGKEVFLRRRKGGRR